MEWYATSGISSAIKNNKTFAKEIEKFCKMYIVHNWGDTAEEDKIMNNDALQTKERIVALYKTCIKNIFIITEYGHKITTILFASEY